MREMAEKKKRDEDLLTEPDNVEERSASETDEVSAVASIAGVTSPLGTGPSYPGPVKKRKKKKLRKGWQKSK